MWCICMYLLFSVACIYLNKCFPFDCPANIFVSRRRTIVHIFLTRKEDSKGEVIYPISYLFMHQDLEDWEKARRCVTFPLI